MFEAKPDCRRFKGEKPCLPGRECHDCPDYDPMGVRILIIKLGAGGDVLRTVALLEGLKTKFPVSHITWVTEKLFFPLLEGHPQIDRLSGLDHVSLLPLGTEYFDMLINLDKVPVATALAEQVNSVAKYGFGMDRFGSLRPFNHLADYAFQLGLSDRLKFHENTQTYPETIYEICALPYAGQAYRLYLNQQQQEQASAFRHQYLQGKKHLIGLNTGSGPVFATKKWKLEYWVELAQHLDRELSVRLCLLGGPDESERNREILTRSNIPLVNTGTDNTLERFIGIVSAQDLVISSDTMAMHIALALGKKIVALFGPTSALEVDLFGQGIKLVSDLDCSPCYRKTCEKDPTCMDLLGPRAVLDAVRQLLA